MPEPHLVFLGLGSNLGDRRKNLEEAITRIDALAETTVQAVASVWETAPVGYLDQGPFYNTACRLVTSLDPETLLRRLKQIEAALGREPGPRYGPRLIDIDILLFDEVVSSGAPALPHPEMHRRSFVLAPLAELAPAAKIADKGEVAELLKKLEPGGIVQLAERLDAPKR